MYKHPLQQVFSSNWPQQMDGWPHPAAEVAESLKASLGHMYPKELVQLSY